jgi:ubiquinol-cytochrome c reductase iron-sulfur subunit
VSDGHDESANSENEPSRTPVELPTPASWSDPHLQPAAEHPEFVERLIGFLFVTGLLSFCAFGAAYWQNWAPWTEGLSLGAGLLLVGTGITAWGKYLMPRGPFVEDRHELKASEQDLEAFTNALVERGATPVRRRKVLGGLLGAGMGVFGIVAAFPLLRSLGPLPKNTLRLTDWKAGTYLVDQSGNRISQYAIAIGSFVPVFPEGLENKDQGQAVDQAIMVHLDPGAFTGQMPASRSTWIPSGFVAYSSVCTHAGCPVRLYERQLELLICPCHQSMFDIKNGGLPIFGPAPRPLPQLPLAIDADGYLYAQSGFKEPVGPGYWERS